MNDIAKRARELIEGLRKNGFKGFSVPEATLHETENAAAHYALVEKLYVDTPDDEYFDRDMIDYDFRSMLAEWFTFDDEKTVFLKPNTTRAQYENIKKFDQVIVVSYQKSCDELEVYRLIDGETPGGDKAS